MQRELVRWLQTLDLSSTVKNPHHDLCNGFAVAEILSRFDEGVDLNKFDKGLSTARRLDNWRQIVDILSRRGCRTISEELVSAVSRAKEPGPAFELLKRLYEHLTQRALSMPPRGAAPALREPMDTDAAIVVSEAQLHHQPRYARPTAATLIHRRPDASEVTATTLKGKTSEARLRAANEETVKSLESAQTKVRTIEDIRSTRNSTTTSKRSNDAPPRREKRGKEAVDRVELSALDPKVVEAVRQREEREKEKEKESFYYFDGAMDLGTALNLHTQRLLELQEQLSTIDSHSALISPDTGSTAYLSTFLLFSARLPLPACEAVWKGLYAVSENIASLVQQRPSEFRHLVLVFYYSISPQSVLEALHAKKTKRGEEPLQRFLRAWEFWTLVGKWLLKREPNLSFHVLFNELLPTIKATLTAISSVSIVSSLCKILCSFVPNEGRFNLYDVVTGNMETSAAAVVEAIFITCEWRSRNREQKADGCADNHCKNWALSLIRSGPRCTSIASHCSYLLVIDWMLPHWSEFSDAERKTIDASFAAMRSWVQHSSWELRLWLLRVFLAYFAIGEYRGETYESADGIRTQETTEIIDTEAVSSCFATFDEEAEGLRSLSLVILAPHVAEKSFALLFIQRLNTLPLSMVSDFLHQPTEAFSTCTTLEGAVGTYDFMELGEVDALLLTRALADSFQSYSTAFVLTVLDGLLSRTMLHRGSETEVDCWVSAMRVLGREVVAPLRYVDRCRGPIDDAIVACARGICTKVFSELRSSKEDVEGDVLNEEVIEWIEWGLQGIA